jgi:hypothetical protein
LGFGKACQIAGVGMGTNLTIGLIMVFGTFLPLAMENVLFTVAGGIICAGLGVACVGLYFSMLSLQLRDADEAYERNLSEMNLSDNNQVQEKVDHFDIDQTQVDESGSGAESQNEQPSGSKKTAIAFGDEEVTRKEAPASTLKKVVVCVIAAIISTTLQFAFEFGSDMIDIAGSNEGPGSTPKSGTAAVVWLLVISIAAVPNILYSLYISPKEVPFASLWKAPWWRHVVIFGLSSISFLAHIHLYGVANTFLPEELGASIAWPVLMIATVTVGTGYSFLLGEWNQASAEALSKLKTGLIISLLGMVIVMVSVVFE